MSNVSSPNVSSPNLASRNVSPLNGLAPAAAPAAIPVGAILPWLLFVPLLLLAIYFVGAEEGATSLIKGMAVHEFVHDGRHLLGFPCH